MVLIFAASTRLGELNTGYEEEQVAFFSVQAGQVISTLTSTSDSIESSLGFQLVWFNSIKGVHKQPWTIAPGQSKPNAEGQASTHFSASSLLSHLKGGKKKQAIFH